MYAVGVYASVVGQQLVPSWVAANVKKNLRSHAVLPLPQNEKILFVTEKQSFFSYGVQTEISLVGSHMEALCDSEITVLNHNLINVLTNNSNGEFWRLAPLTPFNMA